MEVFDTKPIEELAERYNIERKTQEAIEKMEEDFKKWAEKNLIRLTEDNYNECWEKFLKEYKSKDEMLR